MQIPTGQLPAIQEATTAILKACQSANSASPAPAGDATDLPTLEQALEQLMDVMNRIESDGRSGGNTSPEDITEIGEYALRLHENLSVATEKLGLLDEQKQPLANLAIDTALWIALHGGKLETLEPVVDAIAMTANTESSPEKLEQLSSVISRITGAVGPLISEDLEKMNPGRPWRVLLLNQSIVATRSHNTGLMETAFEMLTSKLPEDATRFFSEGMQQMEALDYPAHVREVMEKYHRQWPVNRSLH